MKTKAWSKVTTFEAQCPFCDTRPQHQSPSGALALLAVHFGEMAAETSHDWGRVAYQDITMHHFEWRQTTT